MDMEQNMQPWPPEPPAQKFCKHCGGRIPADAVICTLCGRQVEETAQATPNAVLFLGRHWRPQVL